MISDKRLDFGNKIASKKPPMCCLLKDILQGVTKCRAKCLNKELDFPTSKKSVSMRNFKLWHSLDQLCLAIYSFQLLSNLEMMFSVKIICISHHRKKLNKETKIRLP